MAESRLGSFFSVCDRFSSIPELFRWFFGNFYDFEKEFFREGSARVCLGNFFRSVPCKNFVFLSLWSDEMKIFMCME